MKTLEVKINKKNEVYLDLNDLEDLLDITKVKFYSFEEVDNNGEITVILKFYDKDKKVLELLK